MHYSRVKCCQRYQDTETNKIANLPTYGEMLLDKANSVGTVWRMEERGTDKLNYYSGTINYGERIKWDN